MMDIQEDDVDISHKIKSFLSKDKNFRDPNFDPSPYLIKVLKEKEANQQLLVEKQKELIQLQNECDLLIEEVVVEKHEQFFDLIRVPKYYGEQLQMLKQNMASVKRKVKQTKNLLILTQRDIQQIHLNCYFNKLVHQKLKELQLKLNQYESASLALKNHMYLDCAQNLPVFNGNSVLESTLSARSDNLKLRFLHQAIQQVRLFLYFTPRLRLPPSQRFLERAEDKDDIFNEEMHQSFKKRYILFKKVKCQEYLSSIWGLQGMEQKTGKVGVIYDIIKGIIRIGKASEIVQSFSLDVKKSISNIFQVILYFFSKEEAQRKNTKSTIKWFTSPEVSAHQGLLSVLFSVSAALIRKMIILRRICQQYHINEVVEQLKTKTILEIIRDEMFQLIKKIYFPEISNSLTLSLHAGYQQLFNSLKSTNKFAYWPFFKKIIEKCFQILVQQLNEVQNNFFQMELPQTDFYLKPFHGFFRKKFIDIFHEEYMRQFGLIFSQGRGFNLQNFDNIMLLRQYAAPDIQFCKKYCSQSGKAIKEFINLISYLNSLQAYFVNNNFETLRYKSYRLFFILIFYLKINSTIYRYIVSPTQYDKIIQLRNREAKIKAKEKHIESSYETFVCARGDRVLKAEKKYLKYQQNDHPQLRNVQQLKMIKTSIEMFFYYCTLEFGYLQTLNPQKEVEAFSKEIEKSEPSNYDENLHSKLIRVWQQIIKPSQVLQKNLDHLLCAVLKRWLQLYFVINTCLYLQTGVY